MELLNSEGPILILEKSNDIFILRGTDKKVLGCLTKDEVLNFLNGNLSIIEGTGKVINYLSYPESMKQERNKVYDFIQIT